MSVLTAPPPAGITVPAPARSGDTGRRCVADHPVVRAGMVAWAALGVAGAVTLALWLLWALRVVIVPLTLALFPAAVLTPASRWVSARGVPRTLAAVAVLLAAAGLLAAAVAVLVPQVSGQLAALRSSLASGLQQVDRLLASGPFGLPPVRLDRVVAAVRTHVTGQQSLLTGVLGVAHVAVHLAVGAVLTVVTLFFYLRDGAAVFGWLRDLWPQRLRGDVQRVGNLIWATIGGYIRGQLAVAATNAVLVATGLAVLGVPLVAPLGALTFAGGLFPIVGLLVAGVVAVLVALAEVGPAVAGLTLAVILVVHQLEVHVVAPLVQSRAVRLHPFAVILSLTAGAAVLGVLGAFVAVPVTASVARAVSCLRGRRPLAGA